MPGLLDRPSARRKATYLACALGLFVVNTFLWRGVASRVTGGQPPSWTVTARANAMELRELGQGDADLTGSALRLGLTGSRGLAITVLWNQAIERQRKNEWAKLEFLVRSVTKLQPHFLTPWLFQSWNLSYNVSVESDRVKDKFFYISRGIELLAEGERINRGHPDMRYNIAFYYQNKFGVSDEANTLRSLLQMSCMDPRDRDPRRLRPDGKAVDREQFAEFVRKNPQLVRRLREKLNYNSPDEIVDFLSDNRVIPSRYADPDQSSGLFATAAGTLKSATDQFPIFPPEPCRFDPNGLTPTSPTGDDVDNYHVAKAWFAYAQDPLPDPTPMVRLLDRAEKLRALQGTGKTLPRSPAEVIYRHAPARAQSFVGERLAKEGWFDESGWAVDADKTGSGRWFPQRGPDEVAVGTGRPWSKNAWEQAYALWRDHGIKTGMYLDKTEEIALEEKAKLYRERYKATRDEMGIDLFLNPNISKDVLDSFRAHRILMFSDQNRGMTNFPHHYYRSYTEMDPITVAGRKALFGATRLRQSAEPDRAIVAYKEAFEKWQAILLRYDDFRRDSSIQEDVYEEHVRYLDLVRDQFGGQLRPAVVAGSLLAAGTGGGGPVGLGLATIYGTGADNRTLPLPLIGPLDMNDPRGQPWLDSSVAETVRVRMGVDNPQGEQQPPPSQPQKMDRTRPMQQQ